MESRRSGCPPFITAHALSPNFPQSLLVSGPQRKGFFNKMVAIPTHTHTHTHTNTKVKAGEEDKSKSWLKTVCISQILVAFIGMQALPLSIITNVSSQGYDEKVLRYNCVAILGVFNSIYTGYWCGSILCSFGALNLYTAHKDAYLSPMSSFAVSVIGDIVSFIYTAWSLSLFLYLNENKVMLGVQMLCATIELALFAIATAIHFGKADWSEARVALALIQTAIGIFLPLSLLFVVVGNLCIYSARSDRTSAESIPNYFES